MHDHYKKGIYCCNLFITGSSIEFLLERRAVSQDHADGHVFTMRMPPRDATAMLKEKMPAPAQIVGQCHDLAPATANA
jgi:hypothetical protein